MIKVLVQSPPPKYRVTINSPGLYKVIKITPDEPRINKVVITQTILQGPPGNGVDVTKFVFGETPAGIVDGSNATFTTAFDFVPETVIPSINGLEQKLGTHYITIGNNQIVFNESPTSNEIITVTYIKVN